MRRLLEPSFLEPFWQETPFSIEQIEPPALHDWLYYSGSLTVRLKKLTDLFRVQVLCEKWDYPFASEAKLLDLNIEQKAFIREVYLCDESEPWVFARSILPKETLIEKNQSLLKLGTRPLGELLFDDPHTKRTHFEVAQIKPEHYCFDRIQHAYPLQKKLWGRRSVFYLNEKPLLVCEFFTPGIPLNVHTADIT